MLSYSNEISFAIEIIVHILIKVSSDNSGSIVRIRNRG